MNLPGPTGRPRLATATRLALVTALGGALAATAASPAAADEDDFVRSYHLDIVLDQDGTAHVTLDLTMDFGTQPNRGPYLTYVTRQGFDEAHDRVYEFSAITATSPSDAPDTLHVDRSDGWLELRIGDEDRDDVVGVQTYRVTYDVAGWVNPAGYPWPSGAEPDLDELHLDVLDGFDLPVADLTVGVTGPVPVEAVACFAGPVGSTQACSSAAPGRSARFTQSALPAGQALTVVAGFPAGTFRAEPLLDAHPRPFALTWATGLSTGLVALVGTVLALRRARRGRDTAYLGLTPGLTPAPGQKVATGPRRATAVAVQFHPPVGFHAGQLGTLVDERADPRDVTATIVDLAVRGYLLVQQTEPAQGRATGDWRLIRTDRPAQDLLDYERLLLDEIFAGRDQVELSDLRTTFAASMARVQRLLYADVTARGWFEDDPQSVRSRWVGAGIGLLLGGVLLTAALAQATSWALVGVPVAGLGLLVMVLARSAPARTATGSAVLAQAEGFRLYVATAEAEQLRWEEGVDLFSRYLPFAVAFGLVERWTRVFADLAARGVDLPVPTWYLGSAYAHGAFWSAGTFGSDLAAFTHVADAAIAAPTPGSSGSSGLGGGGFSGGGVGGGGGGSW